MLAKMVIQGLAAAMVIGSAAGLYAQANNSGVNGDIPWLSNDGRHDKHERDHHDDD